ncbi:di-heme oxidoredictase family protein [Rhizobium sp. L1K21]|uniref:di-heme oxidoredictase family protein n=1 Tax=Rhizobium sp. L1K21 TaxID=2954933 RepID=UPI0020934093|nr:di-heme oxidoredictase family protein [Rhizobium sp. L1K21]MCO6188258.1 hypothetical protein [Rhizobium sp. L1K21]
MGWKQLAACLATAFVATTALAAEPWAEKTNALGASGKEVSGKLTAAELEKLIATGEELFIARYTVNDGAGRPAATQAIVPTKRRHPVQNAFSRTSGADGNACSSCHREPVVGGAGDFTANVFASEGFESADFDTTDPQFSSERGTNHLFGAGLIELLAREMTADLQSIRRDALLEAHKSGKSQRVKLETKGVDFGWLTVEPDGIADMSELDGVDMDLVIRPFSQKGVITSLRQFTINAMNQHHGMQPNERYGKRWTGTDDFDEDNFPDEMNAGDVSALVAWQATRPVPTRQVPDIEGWAEAAARGEELFNSTGCSSCHMESLPLKSPVFDDPGPVDVSGTLNRDQVKEVASYDLSLLPWFKTLPRNEKGEVLVPLFGDLKRHTMTDARGEELGNELMAQRFVDRNIFMTAELWGVGSTAPYGHRNDFTTLDSIILAHAGDAREQRDAFADLPEADRSAMIAFLKTLVIEQ